MGGKYTDNNNYGYTPSEAWCAVFIALFSLSALVHSLQAWRAKQWVIYPSLVVGALIEVLGWSGRLWSAKNIYLLTPFLMQICTLIMAPVWFSAYDYTALGQAITKLGPEYSILPPRWYFITFLTADIVSLILQAVGGGQAASGAATGAPTQNATNIMFAGIVFQLISMFIFICFGFDFVLRRTSNRPYAFRARQVAARAEKDKGTRAEKGLTEVDSGESATQASISTQELRGWWLLLTGVFISSLAIICRGVYRSIELHQGWTGNLMRHQIYQNVLDGIPMVIAVAIFNVFNPLWLLPKRESWKNVH